MEEVYESIVVTIRLSFRSIYKLVVESEVHLSIIMSSTLGKQLSLNTDE